MRRPVQMAIEVQIPRGEIGAALDALGAVAGEHGAGQAAPDLIAALAARGFEAEVDFHSGDVWIEVFRGRYWEAQEQVFAALAPHARGQVHVLARNGARWGYRLHGGSLVSEGVA